MAVFSLLSLRWYSLLQKPNQNHGKTINSTGGGRDHVLITEHETNQDEETNQIIFSFCQDHMFLLELSRIHFH